MKQSKHCNKCDTTKPVTDFYKRGEHGYQPKCKECERAYRRANQTRIRAVSANYYRNNKHKWKSHAELTSEQRDIKRERSRRWRADNPERFKMQLDDWRARNPERFNSLSRQRTARKRGNGVYKILKRDLRRLYATPCIYCGRRENITLDHVLPIARGGTHSVGNLAPACKRCNSSKKDRTVMEWRMKKAPTV